MDTPIPASVQVDELLGLSTPQKISLIGVLWDSIDVEAIPKPDRLFAELDRRKAELERNPETAIPWEEILQRIQGTHGK